MILYNIRSTCFEILSKYLDLCPTLYLYTGHVLADFEAQTLQQILSSILSLSLSLSLSILSILLKHLLKYVEQFDIILIAIIPRSHLH